MKKRKLISMYTPKRRKHFINKPMNISELNFGELLYDISDNWEESENRIRIRKWRKPKEEFYNN